MGFTIMTCQRSSIPNNDGDGMEIMVMESSPVLGYDHNQYHHKSWTIIITNNGDVILPIIITNH